MSNKQLTTTVNILDKDYRISGPPEEQEALNAAAQHLDNKMREIRASGKVIGFERIALMAALNIAHEMLSSNQEAHTFKDDIQNHIQSLAEKLDDALL
ncbi:MAG: cell division protein ZapA [Endozoicomonadaceae bacterium]|nr:cell division protein ZapA [Endozoicomonadaceae bacterium]